MSDMKMTRRELGRLTFSALSAARLSGGDSSLWAQSASKPNSKVAGVQIGMNVPYNFGGRDMNADELLDRCLKLNISAVEMRSQPVESFLGSPAAHGQKADAADVRAFRTTLKMDRAAAFRRKFEDAGVMLDVVKFDGIYTMSDAEVDYCFNLARALGARAISCEIDVTHTQRLGRFADKHKLMVGYHGHASTTPAHWETAFSQSKYNGANLDLGHFVAGNNTSPVPFLKQHHARITHVHVKDRKLKEGPNLPFGEGDTPIKEALQAIRDNKWPIQATIEFEYPVPPGSDRMIELAKCVEYCRQALLS